MKTEHLFLIFLLMIGIVGCETVMPQVCPVCPTCTSTPYTQEWLDQRLYNAVEKCASEICK